jgi:ABC-type phosphate transport system permease subunit
MKTIDETANEIIYLASFSHQVASAMVWIPSTYRSSTYTPLPSKYQVELNSLVLTLVAMMPLSIFGGIYAAIYAEELQKEMVRSCWSRSIGL